MKSPLPASEGLKVLFVGMQHDYGDPARGECYEFRNLYGTLARMRGITASYFPYDVHLRSEGRRGMNRMLLDRVTREVPDLCFFVLFTDEIEPATIERISGMTCTVNWFTDDHWRFDGYSRFWAPLFRFVTTTDRSALERYRSAGITNVILTQWAYNHFADPPRPGERDLGVTFVGQVHSGRRALVRRLQDAGIRVQAWGRGWEAGRLPGGDLASVFARSAVNLNFSESSVARNARSLAKVFVSRRADDSLHVRHPWSMAGHVRYLLTPPPPQIKGRTFEVPGAGGFLLTGPAEDLASYLLPGREVAVFADAEELVEKARYYLAHEDEREAIRRAGYERVLREHTYEQRFLRIFKEVGLNADV